MSAELLFLFLERSLEPETPKAADVLKWKTAVTNLDYCIHNTITLLLMKKEQKDG